MMTKRVRPLIRRMALWTVVGMTALSLFASARAETGGQKQPPESPEPEVYTYEPGPVEPFISREEVLARWRAIEERLEPPRVAAKGIYLTEYSAGNPAKFQELLELVERTELNAMVINVKNDWGHVVFEADNPTAQGAGAVQVSIEDVGALMAELDARGIYAIARVVTFKDNVAPRTYPELGIHHVGGGLWQDYNGVTWLNPYNKQAWDYVVDIAKEAALAGFDEIQFDYVRFPTDGNLDAILYPGKDDRPRERVIADFLAYARKELHPYRVRVSADVFGMVTSVQDDMGIGQKLEEVSASVDILSPMVYPSHYIPGNLGLPNPNAMPYETIYRSMMDARKRWEQAGLTGKVRMRPWLQDFSWGHPYGPEEVRAQIQATYDAGYEEWLLWNAANVYTEAALEPAAPEEE